MMQFHPAYTGYRETLDSNVFGEVVSHERSALPWQNAAFGNQNKQIDVYQGRPLTSSTEIARDDQEQMYNWYHTVPLTHDRNYPQTINMKESLHEEFNRKGRMPHERQKRYRTSFTTFQLSRLEEEFNKDMYAVGMKRMRLAGELNLTEKQVKVWFQNRRMKYKRVCQRLHNRRIAVNKLWAQ